MKNIYIFSLITLMLTSCSDFLDTYPGDSVSPETFWKTENDATLALVGCYRDWEGTSILYMDCASDNAYSFHKHENWQVIGNGTMSTSEINEDYFTYKIINRCNAFLENIDAIEFKDEKVKERYKAEVRFIRAYRYFILIQNFGDVPLSLKTYTTIEESRIPRNPKVEVQKFILDELAEVADILPEKPITKGHATKGAALAISMRLHLYMGEYNKALVDAKKIEGLGIYKLFPTYDGLFLEANTGNEESIMDVQYIENDYDNWVIGAIAPNGDGGWSSIVPLNSLVDAYETIDGLTIDEAKAAGKYDPEFPFVNRDPRLKYTVLYPGQDWNGRIFNSFDKTIISGSNEVNNPDFYNGASNASKTGLSPKKYVAPLSQYNDMWNTAMNLIVCRYAEVFLTIAEAKIELGQIDDDMYSKIDEVRQRAGMPKVDRTKYNNQTSLRDLIRRERRAEFAMEGLRRADIIRWNIAKDVLNGPAYGCRLGTIDYNEPNEDKRAKLTDTYITVETRSFAPHNKYYPIHESELNRNPNLTQTEGY